MPPRDELELAWAAGLFEGEGCITADRRGHITLTVTSTDLDVVERFALAVGCGVVRSKELTPRPGWVSQKPQWRWRVHRRVTVLELMERLWPYLGERRRAKFLELLPLRGLGRQRRSFQPDPAFAPEWAP